MSIGSQIAGSCVRSILGTIMAWPTRRHARANAVFSPTHAPPRRDDAGGDRPAMADPPQPPRYCERGRKARGPRDRRLRAYLRFCFSACVADRYKIRGAEHRRGRAVCVVFAVTENEAVTASSSRTQHQCPHGVRSRVVMLSKRYGPSLGRPRPWGAWYTGGPVLSHLNSRTKSGTVVLKYSVLKDSIFFW
jgi:hypothetical protein